MGSAPGGQRDGSPDFCILKWAASMASPLVAADADPRYWTTDLRTVAAVGGPVAAAPNHAASYVKIFVTAKHDPAFVWCASRAYS